MIFIDEENLRPPCACCFKLVGDYMIVEYSPIVKDTVAFCSPECEQSYNRSLQMYLNFGPGSVKNVAKSLARGA